MAGLLARLSLPARYAGYGATAAREPTVSTLRRRISRVVTPADWLRDWLEDPDYGPLLAHLTPCQAEVVVLLLAGYNQREAARILGISHQAARDRKRRAKRRLGAIRAVSITEPHFATFLTCSI